jgi:hypothetical protein
MPQIDTLTTPTPTLHPAEVETMLALSASREVVLQAMLLGDWTEVDRLPVVELTERAA